MKNVLMGGALTLGYGSAPTIATGQQIDLAQSTPQLIGSVVAGIVSTVLINILKAKYPKLFKAKKTPKLP